MHGGAEPPHQKREDPRVFREKTIEAEKGTNPFARAKFTGVLRQDYSQRVRNNRSDADKWTW